MDNIANRIFEQYKATQEDSRRPHLGASVIGQECQRKIWYSFRWAKKTIHEGRLLRIFETGKREEPRVYENLAAIGIEVKDTQAGFSTIGGHFAGSCDGIVNGDTLLEIKTHNTKSFAKLQKGDGIPATHRAQMNVYMKMLDLKKALYFAVCKDTDEIYTHLLNVDEAEANALIAKAEKIIKSDAPLEKISNDPAFYLCKMCDFHAICHAEEMPDRNCRTCLFSTIAQGWRCDKPEYEHPLGTELQRVGCGFQRYLPALIGEVDDVIEGASVTVIYKNGYEDDGL